MASLFIFIRLYAFVLLLGAVLFTTINTVGYIMNPIPATQCANGDSLCENGQTFLGNLLWGLFVSPLLLLGDQRTFVVWTCGALVIAITLMGAHQLRDRRRITR